MQVARKIKLFQALVELNAERQALQAIIREMHGIVSPPRRPMAEQVHVAWAPSPPDVLVAVAGAELERYFADLVEEVSAVLWCNGQHSGL